MLRLGEQPAVRISELLNTADFGIATSTLPLIGKSGTAAAMFDHGLPVIVNREDCRWTCAQPVEDRQAALIIRMGDGLRSRLGAARRVPPVWRLPEVASRWRAALTEAAAPASSSW
jgi:hypothetical protein